MKIKDIIQKKCNSQFVINSLYNDKKDIFALTESTPDNLNNKILCIDFGNEDARFIELDSLILVLKEFYGEEYLIKAINEIKSYDKVKDIEIQGGNYGL